MKLFLHDSKHDVIFGELDLGSLDKTEIIKIDKIIGFLETHHILNRYKELVLAEKYVLKESPDSDEYSIEFSDEI